MPRVVRAVVEPVRVTAAAAELLVRVELDGPAAGVELRGVLVGPRRPGAATVEVAYPLRPAGDPRALRAVIPDPTPWTAQAPFRYDGRVEVWADGAKVDEHPFAVELRAT